VIVFDQPFQVGDKISVSGTYGEVVSIGLRSTRITTPDDNLVSVPNAQVVDGQVSNANAGALDCQVVTDLYLPGWVDEIKAKQIAHEAAASSKYVYLEKPIVVIVKDEFKETFVTHLKVKAYVLDTRYEFLLVSDVTERARRAFREEGLLQPMHGARAYVDLSGLSPPEGNGRANAADDLDAPSSTAVDPSA
jgi:small-conductance mechanosensitive channel